jgi:hypothetical protein
MCGVVDGIRTELPSKGAAESRLQLRVATRNVVAYAYYAIKCI